MCIPGLHSTHILLALHTSRLGISPALVVVLQGEWLVPGPNATYSVNLHPDLTLTYHKARRLPDRPARGYQVFAFVAVIPFG